MDTATPTPAADHPARVAASFAASRHGVAVMVTAADDQVVRWLSGLRVAAILADLWSAPPCGGNLMPALVATHGGAAAAPQPVRPAARR